MLFEPYSRHDNRWSFSLLVDRARTAWELEVVAAGFDCAHLNRGLVTRHESFSGAVIDQVRLDVNKHVDFDRQRYLLDVKRFETARSDGERVPAVLLNRVLHDGLTLMPTIPAAIFVLSGAVVEPGDRLTYWDVFDASQAGR
jgi:hypothetical protein